MMRFRWEPCSRVPSVPLWAMAVVGGWSLLVVLTVGLQRITGLQTETCLFRLATGHPCPTCGSTRIVLGFLEGHGLQVARLNPGIWLAMFGAATLLSIRPLFGCRLRVATNVIERRWLLAAGLFLVILDWWWVLRHA